MHTTTTNDRQTQPTYIHTHNKQRKEKGKNISSHLISSHCIVSHLISPHLISSHLAFGHTNHRVTACFFLIQQTCGGKTVMATSGWKKYEARAKAEMLTHRLEIPAGLREETVVALTTMILAGERELVLPATVTIKGRGGACAEGAPLRGGARITPGNGEGLGQGEPRR